MSKLSREDKFWSKVVKTDGCWLWVGSTNESGHGRFNDYRGHYKNNLVQAHRFSWELHYGPIPTGMCVLHACDHPACVNPQHLFIGTQADNIYDMVSKGRHRHTTVIQCHPERTHFALEGGFPMTIGVDVDGVLADFNESFMKRIVEVTGKDLFPVGYQPTTWDYPTALGYSKIQVSQVWDAIKADPHFWVNLDQYPGTWEFLDCLDCLEVMNHDVYFVTSRVGVDVKWQTERWLQIHGFSKPTVLISSEKGLVCKALKVDLYIDDKVENCEDARDQSKAQVYMLARPWNFKVHSVPRVESIKEFLDIIWR